MGERSDENGETTRPRPPLSPPPSRVFVMLRWFVSGSTITLKLCAKGCCRTLAGSLPRELNATAASYSCKSVIDPVPTPAVLHGVAASSLRHTCHPKRTSRNCAVLILSARRLFCLFRIPATVCATTGLTSTHLLINNMIAFEFKVGKLVGQRSNSQPASRCTMGLVSVSLVMHVTGEGNQEMLPVSMFS